MSSKRRISIIISAVFFAIFGIIALAFGMYMLFINTGFGMAWVLRFPPFRYIVLLVGVGFLVTFYYLLKQKRIGAYVGVISFVLTFIVNLVVAGSFFVHLWAGFLLGLLLLVPLLLGWKSLN